MSSFEVWKLELPEAVAGPVGLQCRKFLLELIDQVQRRFPANFATLELMAELSPTNALRAAHDRKNIAPLVELLYGKNSEKTHEILDEWRLLANAPKTWKHGQNDTHPEKFWFEVYKGGEPGGAGAFSKYKSLALFALEVLTLPHSNAAVERLFSLMGIVRTKLRNRMKTPMLNAIILCRGFLKVITSVPPNCLLFSILQPLLCMCSCSAVIKPATDRTFFLPSARFQCA